MNSERAASQTFTLRTLGGAELWAVAGEIEASRVLGPGKPVALLAYCCCSRDREHSRDLLAPLLWRDGESSRSRQSLRQALWRLRRVVGDAIRTRDDAVLGIDERVRTDREEFLDAVHRNDAPTALRLYAGPFLNALSTPGGDEFEDWAAVERRHLEDALLRVGESHARQLLASGRVSQAREVVESIVLKAPDSLGAHRIAVEVMLDGGDVVAARRSADVLEKTAGLLGGRAPSSVKALIGRARKVDAHPVPEKAAPIVLDLVGREADFSSALAAWGRARRGETQIVVISGTAGIGKSRLLGTIAQRCTGPHSLAVSIRANPGERDVPFGFAAAIARALATLPGAAGISADSARELVALDPGLGSHFATTPSAVDATDVVRRRALAVLDLITAIVEQEPLALLLDDLHWADAASRQLLSLVAGRASDLPLLIIATTRGSSSAIFDQRAVHTLALLPLDQDALTDAIRSSGSWPDTAEVSRFIGMLTSVCEGIPLSVMERLALVRERNLVVLADGVWCSNDWPAATAAIAIASPLDHRLAACTELERAVVLALAVAGKPIAEIIVTQTARALVRPARPTPSNVARVADLSPELAALSTLEVKGLVHRAGDQWLPNHDVVAEHMLALSTPDDRKVCHLSLARTLGDRSGADAAADAVRHYVLGEDDGHAGQQFARVVSRLRGIGDQRSVREMLAELVGERLPESRVKAVLRSVPFWHRAIVVNTRVVMSVAAVVTLLSASAALYLARQPVLTVAQGPATSTVVNGLGPAVRRAIPSIVVALDEGGTKPGTNPPMMHVRAIGGHVQIVAGDSVPVKRGMAAFNTLRYKSDDSVAVFRFEAAGYRSTDVTVKRMDVVSSELDTAKTSLTLAGGKLQGQTLNVSAPSVTVAPGAIITGFVQAEYSDAWPAASVWLSMTPTWGSAREEGRELTPLTTPVQREVSDMPVSVQAPGKVGHYWLLFMMDAEPSGMYALSRTNWTVGRPIWNDGNDLAALSDSTIRQANVTGFITSPVAFPGNWNTGAAACGRKAKTNGGASIKYCQHLGAMFGIEVVVR